MRIDGQAKLVFDDETVTSWPEAKAAVKVTPRAVYPQCPRYIHKMDYAQRSPYVPEAGATTPVPDWKRADWAVDVLAADDPARAGPAGN
jgi:hypothetical protein